MINFACLMLIFIIMNISRLINFLFIVVGGFVAVYAKAQEEQNQYILIAGIMLLMIGVYRISKRIPSRSNQERPPHEDDLENPSENQDQS